MSIFYNLNEYIWIKKCPEATDEFSVPIGARIVQRFDNRVLVVDDDSNEFWINHEDILKTMHKTSQSDADDMIKLGDLQEYSIIRNLHLRYKKKQIYTYIDAILVAINPYEALPIYGKREMKAYRNKKFSAMPPHIFALANLALQEIRVRSQNQCIVISGESGAGKTESTKFILKYLAGNSGKHSWVEKQIIEANPIMEAFGNAKTIRNDNSSRFGKYIDIYFDQTNSIEGARIEQYLLEKSRIVSQNEGELNYHIFYAMLGGMTFQDKERLELDANAKYAYLNHGSSHYDECFIIEFNNIKAAMNLLSFHGDEIWNIFKLLAAILHFGNVTIEATTSQNIDSSEIEEEQINALRVAKFLEIPIKLLQRALTKKSIFIQGEAVSLDLSKNCAIEGRDSFAKAIYGKVFLRIIKRINQTITKMSDDSCRSIGVLDIFGFENFNLNGFEQLCINYANENLQQFFVQHIFKLEQAEYQNENIYWQNIEFVDNQEIVDLIGHRPLNIMSLIDDECKMPKGSDGSLVEKLNKAHGKSSIYSVSKTGKSQIFGIRHYAGTVNYNTNGFLEKNRDSISLDVKNMIKNSTNSYLVDLFSSELNDDQRSKRSIAVSLQFRNSLDSLMSTLSNCHPFFVRCIKPNKMKQSNIFDKSLCVRQLRYSGMLRTAEIRKAGYPIRYSFSDFVDRYGILQTSQKFKGASDVSIAVLICEKYLVNLSYQIGRTKVFLKTEHDDLLESERSNIYVASVITIQRGIRRVIFKRWLEKHRQAAISIEKNWRAYISNRKYYIIRNGFCRLQALARGRHVRQQYLKKKECCIKIQKIWRGYKERKRFIIVLANQKRYITEFELKRNEEEEQLKYCGNEDSKSIADMNFLANLAALRRTIYTALNGGKKSDLEDDVDVDPEIKMEMDEDYYDKFVDNAFAFLDEKCYK